MPHYYGDGVILCRKKKPCGLDR